MSKTIVILTLISVIIGLYKNCHLHWYGSGTNRMSSLGYPVEIHKVTTADGYILELHRIPHPKHYKGNTNKRPIVLLVHGIYSSADCFLINGEEDSLGFHASKEGYDVWFANLRGNHYSLNHLNLSILSMKYWDFSYHEIAIFDIPATIDYILKKTGQRKLHYIGHSLASTIYLAFLSEKPEYNKKLKTGHFLAASVNPAETRVGRVAFSELGNFFLNFFDYGSIGIHFYIAPFNYLLWLVCQTPILNHGCLQVLMILGGKTTTMNMNALPELFTSMPTSTSARCLLHTLQGTMDFRQMNFGEKENLKRYGSAQPPPYNISHIETPTYIHYGGEDNFATLSSIPSLKRQFRKGALKKVIFHKHFNHVDFLASTEAKERVNNVVFDVIRKYENGDN
ncbi:LIPA.2 family protein [Megaselia abdita]